MATTLVRYQARRSTAAAWTSTNEVLLAGEPGYETDTGLVKLGNGTATWRQLSYLTGGLTVNAADTRFGTTRDQKQINNAIAYVKSIGGGKVRVLREDGPWSIGRNITASQKDGGILIDAPNIVLESDGATLTLTDNCDFITIKSTLGGQVTITADVAAADTTLTVTSSAAFTVGQMVFLRLGQAAYDAAEPDYWIYAQVTAIPNGTHITLDRPVGYPLTVASVAAASQKSITPYTTYVSNATIDGTWQFVNPMTGSANAESGINILHARNVRIGAITATNPGAGALVAQFADTVHVDSIRVPASAQQGGQASKGRLVTFSECRNVTVDQLDGESFGGTGVVAEARSEGVFIGQAVFRNTAPGRSTSTPLVATLGYAAIDFDIAHVNGTACLFHDAGGTTGTAISVQDAFFYTSSRPNIQDLGIIRRRFSINSIHYTGRRRYRREIPLAANMAAVVYPLPRGYLAGTRVYTSTTTGITSVYLGTATGQVSDLTSQLTAGQSITPQFGQGSGFGAAYPSSADLSKRVTVTTGTAVPVGANLVIEIDYFEDPATAGTDSVAPAVGGSATSTGLARIRLADLFANTATNPVVFAHRNAAFLFPEETMEGHAACASLPIPAIVIDSDANLLSDGTVALMHDNTVDRTTTATGALTGYSAMRVGTLQVDAGNWFAPAWRNDLHVPLAGEVLDRFGGTIALSIEAKTTAVLGPLIQEIKKRALEDSVLINTSILADIATIKTAGIHACYYFPAATDAANVTLRNQVIAAAPNSIVFQVGTASADIATLVASGIPILAGETNRRVDWSAARAAGVAGLVADDPIYSLALNTRLTAATWAAGTWGHGTLAEPFGVRGTLDGTGKLTMPSGLNSHLIGEVSPTGTATTVDLFVTLTTLPSDLTRYTQIALLDNDAKQDFGTGRANGYAANFKANGQIVLFRSINGSASTQIGTVTAAPVTAPTAGERRHLRLQVTATAVTATDVTTGATVTVTDTTYRAPWFVTVGKSDSTNSGVWVFDTLTAT